MFGRYLGMVSTNTMLAASLVGALLTGFAYVSVPIGEALIDVLPQYGLPEVINRMEDYGVDGRKRYLTSIASLDTLFVICYVTFLVGLFNRLPPLKPFPALTLLPFTTGVLDLAENVQIGLMLRQYPELSPMQVEVASLFTQGKHGLSQICMAVVLVCLVIASLRRLRRKLSNEK